MNWAELEGDEERELKIKESIKKLPGFEQIFKRFENASKMRQWMSEIKKSTIERLKEDADKAYPDKSEEEREALADSKFAAEIAKIFEQSVEKAQLLLNLSVPEAFLVQDQTKERGTLNFLK